MSRKFALTAFAAGTLALGISSAFAGIIMPSQPADHSPPSEKTAQGCIIDPNEKNTLGGVIDPNEKNARSIVDPNFKPGTRPCGPIEGFLKALLNAGDGSFHFIDTPGGSHDAGGGAGGGTRPSLTAGH